MWDARAPRLSEAGTMCRAPDTGHAAEAGVRERMAEGIGLPPLARHTLLPVRDRVARLTSALPAIRAACEGETDEIALQATLACLLYETLAQTNWCGFYRRVTDDLLVVGPYQGSMGCLRIDLSRGVCGRCARTGEIQRVDDVHAVTDHIACDAITRSELVLPVTRAGRVVSVLDLDSPHLAAFSEEEASLLASLIASVFPP